MRVTFLKKGTCADLQRTLANHGLEIEQQTPRGLKAGDLSPVTKHLPPTSELGALGRYGRHNER